MCHAAQPPHSYRQVTAPLLGKMRVKGFFYQPHCMVSKGGIPSAMSDVILSESARLCQSPKCYNFASPLGKHQALDNWLKCQMWNSVIPLGRCRNLQFRSAICTVANLPCRLVGRGCTTLLYSYMYNAMVTALLPVVLSTSHSICNVAKATKLVVGSLA